MLSSTDRDSLTLVATRLQVPPDWLYKLIKFETASTFDPKEKNPTSSARGLIQFMDATAKDMGYRNSLSLVNNFPTFVSQIEGPVYDYLKKYRPFPTKQSLYLAVFYPAYRKKSLSTAFPKNVQNANPGIRLVGDYVRKVDGDGLAGAGLTVLALYGAGLIAYKWLREYSAKARIRKG